MKKEEILGALLAQEQAHHNPEKKITPGMPELLRDAAAQGAVLLENRALPFPEGSRISVFGRCQVNWFCTGYGSGGDVNRPYQVGLLEGLREKYAIDRVSQEQMPEFIKNVLEENGDRSMEEFGDTLLGLGIWLGETAIGKKKGRHWLWDQRHGVCIVSQGDEPSGIAPSLALNYAWQKKKPENVDRLCRLLLDDWE